MLSAPALGILPQYVSASLASGDAAGVVSFGERVEGAVRVPARQLGGGSLVETWSFSRDEVTFGSVAAEETKPIEELTREVYGRVIGEVRSAGYPYFLRIWNHVGGLNEIERGLERYQHFCAGRHDAFIDAGYHHDVDLPAASAVGTPGRGLVMYYLAAREPGLQIENPRQVSAYHYPRQYGPKSPSFSRATIWRDTVFLSGTSSVVGHATAHAGDVIAQLEETLRNIATLVPLESVIAAKTYIRHAADYDAIAGRLASVFPVNLYLEADICRPDLLLEIEAVARAGTQP